MSKFWEESTSEILDNLGIQLEESIQKQLIIDLATNASMYQEMSGELEQIRGYDNSRVSELERQLRRERNKVICRDCNGYGNSISLGPCHNSTHSCSKCGGSGFIYNT